MEDFKIKYQKAYEHIMPSPDYLEAIYDRLEEKHKRRHFLRLAIMRPVVAVCAVLMIVSMTLLTVMAKSVPAVYGVVEKYAPALADFVLPVEISDTACGITMQVEAVNVEEKTAEIIVSFSDAEGSDKDLIKGKVDLYDSYDLQSYGATYDVGGCSFLEYDVAEDKAYFKIDLSTDGQYDKGKLRFRVHQLLTDVSKEEKQIELNDIIKDPATKTVSLNGMGGMENQDVIARYIGTSDGNSSLPAGQVMDIVKADESMAETLTVTGVGYTDGLLRIQICRGNFSDADRHVQLFLTDKSGAERHEDFSLMWHEEVDEETIIFEEYWFLIEENDLEEAQAYGIFYITDGSVAGDWEVTCAVR